MSEISGCDARRQRGAEMLEILDKLYGTKVLRHSIKKSLEYFTQL